MNLGAIVRPRLESSSTDAAENMKTDFQWSLNAQCMKETISMEVAYIHIYSPRIISRFVCYLEILL